MLLDTDAVKFIIQYFRFLSAEDQSWVLDFTNKICSKEYIVLRLESDNESCMDYIIYAADKSYPNCDSVWLTVDFDNYETYKIIHIDIY